MAFCEESLRSDAMYLQCSLVQGSSRTVSYLPIKFAIPGRLVKLKNKDGAWDDGWEVAAVYGDPRRLTHFEGISRAHLRATGDSLPKKGKRQ